MNALAWSSQYGPVGVGVDQLLAEGHRLRVASLLEDALREAELPVERVALQQQGVAKG